MKKLAFFLMIAFPCLQLSAQDSTYYSIYHNIRKSGFIKINRMADGWSHIWLKNKDRSRETDIHFSVKTNSQGAFEQFNANGIQYPFDSTQTKAVGIGKKFKLLNEKDTTTKDFKSLVLDRYLYISGLNEFIFPVLTDTALHGEQVFQQKKILEKTLSLNGRTIKAALWGLARKDSHLPPLLSWFYPNHRLMGQFNFWAHIIANEMEPLKTELKRISDSVYFSKAEQLSSELLSKTINRFALYNCNVVDVEQGITLTNQTVLVNNGSIENIGDTLSVKIPNDYNIIAATNKTVMPGLWDLHTHYAHATGFAYFLNGVTSVRDLGNSADIELVLQKTNQGLLVGPRIAWMSGFIDNLDNFAGPCGILINTIEEGIKAVYHFKKAGYQSIKLYSSVKPEFVKPLAAEAHKLGMKVHGHVPAFTTAMEAIQYGYDEINHLNFILLGFYGNQFDNRVGRNVFMTKMANTISPYSAYGQQLIQLMKKHKTVLDATSLLLTNALPKKIISAKDSAINASVDTVHAWLKAFLQNGIRLIPGTDGTKSDGIVTELKNYIKAGVSNAEALRMVTLEAASYCGWAKQLGTVSKGKLADLIVLDDDPLLTINALEKINMVIANGKLFYIKDLRVVNVSSQPNLAGSIDDDE